MGGPSTTLYRYFILETTLLFRTCYSKLTGKEGEKNERDNTSTCLSFLLDSNVQVAGRNGGKETDILNTPIRGFVKDCNVMHVPASSACDSSREHRYGPWRGLKQRIRNDGKDLNVTNPDPRKICKMRMEIASQG